MNDRTKPASTSAPAPVGLDAATPGQAGLTPGRKNVAMIMALYLLGIFMGAIDTGIVTPGRTIIQNDLGVTEQTGIWMITIYTLAYAAAIPVMGKLADRFGRKRIYLVAIALFGIGSLLCGLSQDVHSFEFLVAARALQAVGGGGIIPIATAEFGTEVPEEKRGMALGLVGGVYGIANIFGASAGSLILDIVGAHNWQWIFYVNVPIALAIVAAGVIFLPNHKVEDAKRIDILGNLLLVAMILALLYGLRNIDFFDLVKSVESLDVWPYLLGFVVLLPLFILAERRADDPVLNLRYFTNRGIGLTLILSALTGFILMGVIFVPQLSENALHVASGKGGYFVIILGLFSGVGAPLSGRLTDKYGPKRVLGLGVLLSLLAAAVTIWWLIPHPGWPSVFASLALMGLGLGFTVGSPINYMMLERTDKAEANSALGTLSLMRSIGTTVAPALMIGMLAHAGTGLQTAIMNVLPSEVKAPTLPYAAELQAKFDAMKANPDLADKLKDVTFPDLNAQQVVKVDMNGGGTLPADLVELLKTSDVTTIVDRTKTVATRMFATQTPTVQADIIAGVDKGLGSLDTARADMGKGLDDMSKGLTDMTSGLAELDSKIPEMTKGLSDLKAGISGVDQAIAGMKKGRDGLSQAIAGMTTGVKQQQDARAQLAQVAGMMQQYGLTTVPPGKTLLDFLPPNVASALPDAVKTQLTSIRSLAQLQGQISGLDAAISALQSKLATTKTQYATLGTQLSTTTAKRAQMVTARDKLAEGLASVTKARADLAKAREDLTAAKAKLTASQADLDDTITKLTALKAGVPGAFDQARDDYLAQIEARRALIEQTYQSTLGDGFRNLYLLYGAACVVAMAALLSVPAVRRRAEAAVS
ncbi:MFS transporter [Propioniciclava tarda]|uniref:MFS transporter n=1 Tax=Propioniciclava tarda TaxID=433330 RepID=A0A4Q9KKI5_PROTD|nr:MFS transporter [Propioniciclava tarda]TBT94854.1 MFS transporter [Propioniciclava tarda]SMO63757.1 drug resistance transporter, EmrB/QacA subfamily [Propioniciclava tarda]HQA31659.1 MFS transporter [Propioniciclava tarda]